MDPLLKERLVESFRAVPGVIAVYVFGSVARGTARTNSDVDVAVLFERTPPERLTGPRFALEGDLERTLGRPVDLIVLNGTPADLRARVLRDGQLLVDADPAARIRFEVQTRNERFDLEPILAAYRTHRDPSQRPRGK